MIIHSSSSRANLLSHALDYASRGWQVLPVHGVVDQRCTCGDTGCTVVVVTHERTEDMPVDRVLPMSDGRFVSDSGTPLELAEVS